MIRNAVAGLGLAPEIASVLFPMDVFLVESDVTVVGEHAQRFVDGLTRWRPAQTRSTTKELPLIRVEGRDALEAFSAFNAMCIRRQWGDGLPLIPPTPDKVEWILLGTDLPRDTVLGKFLPRGGIVSIETLAVALAMAGGRPEYLPVLHAAVRAILDPELEHEGWQATSSSTFPVVVVNGTIARDIRLNAGFGLLGPDPRHPAGASIGRAIRLLQQNVGGALPGTGTMAMFGAMRYTNAVFAEDEPGLPPGWAPFSVEHLGYPTGVNSVAVSVASGADNIIRRGIGTETLEFEATASLYRIASYMKSHNANAVQAHLHGTPGILLIPRIVANQLAAQGWTRRRIQEFLWEHSRIPRAEAARSGLIAWMQHRGAGQLDADPWPITNAPENIAIVVAGGAHPTHAFWMQTALVKRMTGASVELPSRWQALIDSGAKALGYDDGG